MGARRPALLVLAIAAGLGSCRRGRPPPERSRIDWDRAVFALQLVGHEYREQTENGDFAALPSLLAVLDGARWTLPAGDPRASWLAGWCASPGPRGAGPT